LRSRHRTHAPSPASSTAGTRASPLALPPLPPEPRRLLLTITPSAASSAAGTQASPLALPPPPLESRRPPPMELLAFDALHPGGRRAVCNPPAPDEMGYSNAASPASTIDARDVKKKRVSDAASPASSRAPHPQASSSTKIRSAPPSTSVPTLDPFGRRVPELHSRLRSGLRRPPQAR
jgi:hypothetical protein